MKKLIITCTICLVSSYTIALTEWSTPVLLSELNDSVIGQNASSPYLSGDGLTMYFTRKGSDGVNRMYEAYRDTSNGVFHTTREISELYDGKSIYTDWVSGDGLRLYYTKMDSTQTKTVLHMALRSSVGEEWTETMTFSDIHTYGVYDAFCSLSSDELTMYYSRGNTPDNYSVYQATRSSINEQFSNPSALSELNIDNYNFSPFVMMSDQKTIFFSSGSHGHSDRDLYVATRDSIQDPFSNISPLNINHPTIDMIHPFVTSDYSTLYFRTPEGIWTSQAVPEPATLTLLAMGGLALLRKRK